jgi:glycosyltransferase involved in cell wall biosynthesis
LPLVIAGIVQDEDYFRQLVEPHLGAPDITYAGPVGPAERDALLGGALALLHLIGFAEPFGLSVVESLATGTPVIAYPLGSMPEIIRPGRTGFLVDDLTSAVAAVGEVAALSRRHCRDDAEERFTASRMVADYAELFARVASGGPSAVNRSMSRGNATSANRTDASLAP